MFNKIIFFSIAICLCTTQLHAGPANPEPVTISQPDGSKILTRLHGDEFQNWTEHIDSGHTIIRNKSNGFWEYASQNADGTLRGSGIKVIPDGSNAPSNIKKGLVPPRNKEHAEQMNLMLKDVYQERLNAAKATAIADSTVSAATGDWVPVPVSGSKKMLLILVSFADRALATTPASWNSLVFDTTAKSVAKYYQENSFSTLSVSPVATSQPGSPTGIISVTLATNHPNTGGSYTFASDQAWGNAALAAAAPYVNYASLDTNGNGILETSEVMIYFIVAGYETSASSGLTPSVWAHAWWTTGTGLTAGTKNVQRWSQNGEYYNATTQMTMGVIAHELGHQMGGLPDLYDTSGTNGAMGYFSLMASGSWGGNYTGSAWETGGTTPTALDAWSREFLGWTAPVTPTTSGALSLAHPLSSQSAAYKFISPLINATEYFLVENRYPTGWDLGLKRQLGAGWTGGLLITHIDITSGTAGYNDINSYTANNVAGGGHQGVVPVQASTASCNMLTGTSRGCSTTLYYSGNNTNWGPSTTPNSNYYNGTATNFSLTGISAPGATMTGSISFTPPVTKTLTVSKNGTGSGTVTSAPAGISCGSTCSASFLAPTSITLTAAGDTSSGSIFTGWSGGGCSGTGTCVVNLTDNTSVTATFATTTLGEALNIPGITITTSSNANWFPESSTSHDGISAAQSGDISDSQSSFMEFTVHGPGLLSFWWKVSSESGWDFLKFYIDGVPQNIDISGDVDWTQVSGINIPSGSHTLRWTYSKDGSASNGSDAGWVDEIFMEHTLDVFIDGAGSGNVASSPSGINCSSGGCAVNYNLGTLVTLMATPSGSSTFGGWSGCTTPVGTICNIIMNERKSVTATFNAPNKVKILNGSSYATIADAYAAANAGATIMLAQDTFNSDLTLDLNKAVTLSGGWYPDFHGLTGLYSYLQGVLTIANGSLTVENLIVK